MKEYHLTAQMRSYQWDELSAEQQALIQVAKEQTNHSYCPYSNFHVGAAAKLANGVIIRGCNQENAAFPVGLCAERTAIFAAGAQYPDVPVNVLAIAARGTDGELVAEPVSPCCSCRQVMVETESRYGRELVILLYGRNRILRINGIRELMPLTFTEF